jgi:hypothetical protein
MPTKKTISAIQYFGKSGAETRTKITNKIAREISAAIMTCFRFIRSAQTPPTKVSKVPLSILAARTNPRVVASPPESMMTIAMAIGNAPEPRVTKRLDSQIRRKLR